MFIIWILSQLVNICVESIYGESMYGESVCDMNLSTSCSWRRALCYPDILHYV